MEDKQKLGAWNKVQVKLLYLQPLTKLQNLRPKLKAPQIRLY